MIVLDEQLKNAGIGLLRRLFQLKEFKTRQLRCGKVALVSHASVQYYEVPTSKVQRRTW